MADENNEPTNEPNAGAATDPEPDWKALYEQALADVDKWKTMSRKNEGKAKSNADAAEQLADLSERLAAIEGENAALKASAERSALVAKVAKATGVPEQVVSALSANDEKALTEAATSIAEAFKVPGGAPPAPEAGRFPHGAKAGDSEMRDFVRQLTGRTQ